MEKRRPKTYLDTLIANKGFKRKFEKEYQKLAISEQIVRLQKSTHLIQSALAKPLY